MQLHLKALVFVTSQVTTSNNLTDRKESQDFHTKQGCPTQLRWSVTADVFSEDCFNSSSQLHGCVVHLGQVGECQLLAMPHLLANFSTNFGRSDQLADRLYSLDVMIKLNVKGSNTLCHT